MISEERKAQQKRAKRKYLFKQMLMKKIGHGAKYVYAPDNLIQLYMDQPENDRFKAKTFLQRHCLVDAPDTLEGNSYRIPLETSQPELIELLARFFLTKGVHASGVRRTFRQTLNALRIIPSIEDLPEIITDIFEERRPSTFDAARVILEGLRSYGRYTDGDILKVLDYIADQVNNPT